MRPKMLANPGGSIFWAAVIGLTLGCAAKPKPTLTVSAASDLTNAFREIGAEFERQHGVKVNFNFGSSGNLARQIEQGAPVDVFASASVSYVDELEKQNLVEPGTKSQYAQGRLVCWQRADTTTPIVDLADLAKPEFRRIAIANPDHAPYGAAARQALQALGIWGQVEGKLVIGENIRQTFQYAETGNVDAALVALSLCRPEVGRWQLVPDELHSPLNQTLAVIASTRQLASAKQFATFVTGPEGRVVLKKYGLVVGGEELPPEMTRSKLAMEQPAGKADSGSQ